MAKNIYDACCGSSMVMMKFSLVKGKTSDEASGSENGNVPHGYGDPGTKIHKDLVDPWVVKLDRVVAVD